MGRFGNRCPQSAPPPLPKAHLLWYGKENAVMSQKLSFYLLKTSIQNGNIIPFVHPQIAPSLGTRFGDTEEVRFAENGQCH